MAPDCLHRAWHDTARVMAQTSATSRVDGTSTSAQPRDSTGHSGPTRDAGEAQTPMEVRGTRRRGG